MFAKMLKKFSILRDVCLKANSHIKVQLRKPKDKKDFHSVTQFILLIYKQIFYESLSFSNVFLFPLLRL
jgi:hypothetical protein